MAASNCAGFMRPREEQKVPLRVMLAKSDSVRWMRGCRSWGSKDREESICQTRKLDNSIRTTSRGGKRALSRCPYQFPQLAAELHEADLLRSLRIEDLASNAAGCSQFPQLRSLVPGPR